jgi:hypothetical protein
MADEVRGARFKADPRPPRPAYDGSLYGPKGRKGAPGSKAGGNGKGNGTENGNRNGNGKGNESLAVQASRPSKAPPGSPPGKSGSPKPGGTGKRR